MKYAKGHKTSKRKPLFYIGVVVSIVLLVCSIAFVSVKVWYDANLQPVSTEQRIETIEIPAGASVDEIASTLQENGLIRNTGTFLWYLRLNSLVDAMKAGTYELDASMSMPEIIAVITDGKVVEKRVTILPGKRLDQIRASLIASGFSETDVEAALEATQYAGHPALIAKPSDQTLEGYLFPETFNAASTTTAKDIVKKSLDQMAEELSPDLVAAFEQQGLNIHQAVTLASIVLKESSNANDQKVIAGVFYNRLNRGMPLGSDVTYQYIADITGQERSAYIDSPYNTRKYTGLPPGPIANTNKSSLNAVAYPTSSDYLYFVAGDNGNIYFGKTLAEHEENVHLYCHELCSTY